MVPYIKVKDNMELSEFIKTHVVEINSNNFTEVYKDALNSLDRVSKLTELFLDAGIDPLEYMEEVPTYYLANSAIFLLGSGK